MDADLLAQAKTLKPGGPKRNTFIWTDFRNNRLYTAGGYFDPIADNWENPGIVQVLHGDEWELYEDDFPIRTGYLYRGTKAVAVDPKNSGHVYVGARTGLYEFQSGRMVSFYNRDNSILQAAMDRGKNWTTTMFWSTDWAMTGTETCGYSTARRRKKTSSGCPETGR